MLLVIKITVTHDHAHGLVNVLFQSLCFPLYRRLNGFYNIFCTGIFKEIAFDVFCIDESFTAKGLHSAKSQPYIHKHKRMHNQPTNQPNRPQAWNRFEAEMMDEWWLYKLCWLERMCDIFQKSAIDDGDDIL